VGYAGAITLSIAVLGAVLGLLNTWRSYDASRVKLKVVPGHAPPVGGANPAIRFYIGVTNLSAFPITVDNVGFLYKGTKNKGVLIDYLLSDGDKLPKRLEPRSSASVYCDIPSPLRNHPVRCAYVTTACGVTRTGTSHLAGDRQPRERATSPASAPTRNT
jgi:hypothetical protein